MKYSETAKMIGVATLFTALAAGSVLALKENFSPKNPLIEQIAKNIPLFLATSYIGVMNKWSFPLIGRLSTLPIRKRLAIHEAGHLVAGRELDGGFECTKLSIMPCIRGNRSLLLPLDIMGGYVAFEETCETPSEEQYKNNLVFSYAGPAAQKAFKKAGLFFFFEKMNDERDALEVAQYIVEDRAENLTEKQKKAEVKNLLDEARTKANSFVAEHRPLIEAFAAALMKNPVMDSEAIDRVYTEYQSAINAEAKSAVPN